MRFFESHNSLLQDSCQHSYQEIAALLFKRSQHSYQEIASLLSRDYNTPVNRLQHSCREIIRLLSRDHSTLIKRMLHFYQEIATKHRKIIEYLIFLPVHSSDKVSHSLKNGRRYHNFWVTL